MNEYLETPQKVSSYFFRDLLMLYVTYYHEVHRQSI